MANLYAAVCIIIMLPYAIYLRELGVIKDFWEMRRFYWEVTLLKRQYSKGKITIEQYKAASKAALVAHFPNEDIADAIAIIDMLQ